MTPEQAGQIIAVLNAAFPNDTLEPATVALWVDELTDLQNPEAAMDTARSIARGSDKFPTLAEFRRSYRHEADRRRQGRELEEAPDDDLHEIPQSVKDWMNARGVRNI